MRLEQSSHFTEILLTLLVRAKDSHHSILVFVAHDLNGGLTINAPGVGIGTEFEEECGMSRFFGGVHFPPSIHAGADIGRDVGTRAYNYLMGYINGTP